MGALLKPTALQLVFECTSREPRQDIGGVSQFSGCQTWLSLPSSQERQKYGKFMWGSLSFIVWFILLSHVGLVTCPQEVQEGAVAVTTVRLATRLDMFLRCTTCISCILPVKDGVCGSTKSEVLSHAKTEEAIYLQDLQGLKLSHPRPVYMPQSQVWPFAVRALSHLWASKNTSLMHKVHVRRTRPDTNALRTRP